MCDTPKEPRSFWVVTKSNTQCGTCQLDRITDRDKQIELKISKEQFDSILEKYKVIKPNNPFDLLSIQKTIINIYENKNI